MTLAVGITRLARILPTIAPDVSVGIAPYHSTQTVMTTPRYHSIVHSGPYVCMYIGTIA